MRTIFIGDVHGCLEELKQLIQKLNIKSDRVILLGDLINRGPDSVGVVKFVYENQFECLMGNHEYEYLKNYKKNPIYQELYQQLGETLHKWIQQRPYYIEDKNFIAVHAGLIPNQSLKKSKPAIITSIRTYKDIPWYEYYKGKKYVIYGHWARKGLTIRNHTIGLDSGCVYGKFLSAFILEEKKIIQIPAKKKYYIPPSSKI